MRIQVSAPAQVCTDIQLPASKSISNRALIINALAKGTYKPENLSDCDDTNVMVKALASQDETIDIMAAGTAMRFLTAFLSVTEGTRVITGTERMQQRPIEILVNALKMLGAEIKYERSNGFPPLRISGKPLEGGAISLKGNVSSQYISALLMIAPILKNGLKMTLTGDIISKPYINLTLQLMKDFGAEAEWLYDNCIEVRPKPYTSVPFTVESDWSAASYWYQMAALAPQAEIQLNGLFADSYQGDSKVAELFTELGVETIFNSKGALLRKTGVCCEQMEYNFINEPDLTQTFAVTCAVMGIPFRFSGLHTLKIKETDRIAALIAELSKLGYVLKETGKATLYWDGERQSVSETPAIKTYEDHRMAMAFAPACLRIPSITICDPQVVSKSYPHYWEDLTKAGFSIQQED
ncbi:3-phosphoshikimate 1-carboxyvinyltransferase [Bacteroides luti]|uniref:3-phosphoshikimate 1-carboxyvinyltransferase n=1 Tax=Bacteroides luti TaxID=1297750 RepID=A0A1M5BVU1_9BACE|nr:3-phosphoshikimate 1-carboxyvinyltransferase [Bacteroides luti]SHF46674.1 3-phosphoshikimate 1-carboxyvinyltransferase [Bacteroides luti]